MTLYLFGFEISVECQNCRGAAHYIVVRNFHGSMMGHCSLCRPDAIRVGYRYAYLR